MTPPEAPTDISPSSGAPPPDADNETPSYTHTRTGKIARLPKALRDKVNFMILDGVPFKKILESLGDAGKDINEGSLTTWKAGGYLDWLLDSERIDAVRLTADSANDLLAYKAGPTVQEAGRSIAATQLYELMLCFNPKTLADALKKKPELYFRIIDCLARLSEGEAICSHRRAQESALQSKLHAARQGARKNVPSEQALKEIARESKLI